MPILRKTEIFEEFVMEKKIIYLKAEQSSYVNHGKIHIGDIASVFCEDKGIEKKIKNIVLYEFEMCIRDRHLPGVPYYQLVSSVPDIYF